VPSPPTPAATLIVVTPDADVITVEPNGGPFFGAGYTQFPRTDILDEDTDTAAAMFGRADGDHCARSAALRALSAMAGVVLRGGTLRHGAHGEPEATRIVPAGTWVTQPHCADRIEERVYVVEVDNATELSHGAQWSRPADVLRRWTTRQTLLEPMVAHALECLELGVSGLARRLSAPPEASGDAPIANEVLRGVRQVPLITPTLPPAAHTNAYVIGHERLIVVDPAPFDAVEREKLIEYVETLERRGAKLDQVVLTHHHHDHFGAATSVADAFDAPIAAHAETKARLEGRVAVSRELKEGDRIELGADAKGDTFTLDVLFTPGHAPGHVVLVDRREGSGAMIVGDMVAAVGTIVVDPEDGDMARYIAELRRLSAMDPRLLFPAHGPPIVGGKARLDFYVSHRLAREAKVLAALERIGAGTPDKLLPDAYADTPVALYPLAARACLAHLVKLVADGAATQEGRVFRARR